MKKIQYLELHEIGLSNSYQPRTGQVEEIFANLSIQIIRRLTLKDRL